MREKHLRSYCACALAFLNSMRMLSKCTTSIWLPVSGHALFRYGAKKHKVINFVKLASHQQWKLGFQIDDVHLTVLE